MIDIEKKQREILLDLDTEMDWDSGLREYPDVSADTFSEIPDYIRERLEELLAKYINDDNNYVVEGAYITCDQMSRKPVQMYYWNGKLGIKGEGGSAEIKYEMPKIGISLPCFELNPDEIEIGRLHAINAAQTANGLKFATISDRSCLRDKKENENKKEGKNVASIISIGNCGIMRDSDVLEIERRKGMAKIYGTCYCLIKPDAQWVNPYCMECLVESDEQSAEVDYCYAYAHHHTMNWDTEEGQKEGLTRLSTLLCTRGGIITITWSGQRIKKSSEGEVDRIDANNIDVGDTLDEEEIVFIATIYGEGTTYSDETRQALAHVIMNRLGVREWSKYEGISDIIKNTGFDAYGGNLYLEAEEYLKNRDYTNETIERVIDAVLPVYRGEKEDITNNAVLFYSPNAQAKLHEQNPSKYKNPPGFVNDQVEEVHISGTENDDIRFYKYKD